MDTENATDISSSETTQETNIANANFGSRDIIFYVYLVVLVGIFGAFVVHIWPRLYGNTKIANTRDITAHVAQNS